MHAVSNKPLKTNDYRKDVVPIRHMERQAQYDKSYQNESPTEASTPHSLTFPTLLVSPNDQLLAFIIPIIHINSQFLGRSTLCVYQLFKPRRSCRTYGVIYFVNALLLPGSSKRNKEWIGTVATELATHFQDIRIVHYQHWDTAAHEIDLSCEVGSLAGMLSNFSPYGVFKICR